jgi:hypothetical protein
MNTTDTLPAEVDAEREVLVALLIYPDECGVAGAKLLSPEYFFDDRYAALAGEILDQLRSDDGIDPATIARNLKTHRAFPGGDDDVKSLIQDLGNEYASRHQFPNKCAAIIEAYRKRRQTIELGALSHEARNGAASHEIIRDTLSMITRWRDDSAGFGRRDRFTLAELRAAHPTLNPIVVDGLLRQGETANIISVSKIGKSWLAYNLALSQITQRPWLGRFNTSGGRVLIIDNELHASTLAHRIPTVGDAMGIPRDEYENDLEVWPLRGRLRSLSDLATEFDALDPGTFSMIVLDAKYRFAAAGVSENENAAEAQFYNEVDRLAERTGAAIVLIHHSSKGGQADKRVTDVGSGAGAQSRAADTHLILREHEQDGVCVLDAALRSFAPIEPLALRWSFPLWMPDGSADPAALKRQPTGNQQRQQASDREGIEQIIKALRSNPGTERDLRKRACMGKERLERLLAIMVRDGHAETKHTTIRGNETDEYHLSE